MCNTQGCKLLAGSRPLTEKEHIQAFSSWRQTVSLLYPIPRELLFLLRLCHPKMVQKAEHVYTFGGNICNSYYGCFFHYNHLPLSPSPKLHLVCSGTLSRLKELSLSSMFFSAPIWLLIHWRLTIPFITPLLKGLLQFWYKNCQNPEVLIPTHCSQCAVCLWHSFTPVN